MELRMGLVWAMGPDLGTSTVEAESVKIHKSAMRCWYAQVENFTRAACIAAASGYIGEGGGTEVWVRV